MTSERALTGGVPANFKAFADAISNVTRTLQELADAFQIALPPRHRREHAPSHRPNAPRRRMRTPGGRIVRRVSR